MKRILLCVLLVFAILQASGKEVTNILFFTPIIYESALEAAAKDKNLSKNLEDILLGRVKYFSPGKIFFSVLPIQEQEKQLYDQSFTLSFSLAPHIKYNVFAKNNCIMKVIREDNKNDRQSVYVRDIKIDNFEKFPEEYRNFSYQIMQSVYSAEDMFPLFRKKHPTLDTVDFEITGYNNVQQKDIFMGIKIPCISTVMLLESYGGKWKTTYNSVRNNKLELLFSISLCSGEVLPELNHPDYIGSAYVMNTDNIGFNAKFFPNGGLKSYIPKKQDKWEKETVWTDKGTIQGTYTFPPGYLEPKKEVPREFFPTDWITASSLDGTSLISAYYWDNTTKSPCYKLILRVSGLGKVVGEFMFSKDIKQINALYDKMMKDAETNKGKSVKWESPVNIKGTEIGHKSFGVSTKDIVAELVFIRGDMIAQLKCLDTTKDVREFACELDKDWKDYLVSSQKAKEPVPPKQISVSEKDAINIAQNYMTSKKIKYDNSLKPEIQFNGSRYAVKIQRLPHGFVTVNINGETGEISSIRTAP